MLSRNRSKRGALATTVGAPRHSGTLRAKAEQPVDVWTVQRHDLKGAAESIARGERSRTEPACQVEGDPFSSLWVGMDDRLLKRFEIGVENDPARPLHGLGLKDVSDRSHLR